MKNQNLNFAAVYHTPDSVFAYPVNSNTLCLRLKTAKDDCTGVFVRYKNIYEHNCAPSRKKMRKISSDQYSDYFEVEITESGKRFKYFFEISDRSSVIWDFSYNGFTPYNESYNEYFFYPYLFGEDVVSSPEWSREGLIYQIFIDRFYNGNKSNDPANCKEWNELPASKSFYGGDFKGVSEKLEYIASLGATILYMNPIFLSDTNHKYDTIDYYKIDPAFGTLEEARDLVGKAHNIGIRIVLDAVFNHCSDKNELFVDVVKNGENSKYYNWFSITGPRIETCPPNYDSFAGLVPKMPRLNSSNREVQDYCIKVAAYWTKTLDIDGWRLDVADEVSHVLWRKFRNELKNIKPDIYILGEVWNRATPWLSGDEFDSVTNYKFKNALLSFAGNNNRWQSDFWNEVQKNEMNYKTTTLPFLVNLVSSHDVKRVLTELGGNKALVRLIFVVVMTYRGIPLLYYGDEIGIEGGDDPDNRRTMKWDESEQNTSLLSLIRGLGALRKTSNALGYGEVDPLKSLPPRVVGYKRTFLAESSKCNNNNNETGYQETGCKESTKHVNGDKKSEILLILANFNPEPTTFDMDIDFDENVGDLKYKSCFDKREFFKEKNSTLKITLDGYDFLVMKQASIL